MKRNYLKSFLLGLAVAVPASIWAGNIPQYSFSKTMGGYEEITDGTPIRCSWGGNTNILPTGEENPNEFSATGFPIGFDFRMGGATFDQFIPTNAVSLWLGKGKVDVAQGAFHVSFQPIMYGLESGSLSYKTEGTLGNRVFIVQYKDVVVAEQNALKKGKYNAQIRLHEADGTITYSFQEVNTIYSALFGFSVGIQGWDGSDALMLTGKGLDKDFTKSTKTSANMLDQSSYVLWDNKDSGKAYEFNVTFTPAPDTPAPKSAPTNLSASLNETTLTIKATRGADSDATVILLSEQPITAADLPTDGETFRANYLSSDGRFQKVTQIGNALPLYYGNGKNITVTYPIAKGGTTYYICALPANGYPNYGRDNMASLSYKTTQPAPSSISARTKDQKTISLSWSASYPVIIAATDECLRGEYGYTGRFGQPDGSVKVGDQIPGGGTVIYIGDAKTFDYEVQPNRMTYFRAWTLDGTTMSATAVDDAAVPTPSIPYEPAIETYPLYEQLMGWTSTINQFCVSARDYDVINHLPTAYAVAAISYEGAQVYLETPRLDLSKPVTLTFDMAMETVKPAAENEEGSGILLPQGNKPGVFGPSGFLKISANGSTYKTITEYAGTMVSFDGADNWSGSSSFVPVTVTIPAVGEGKTIRLDFKTEENSYLYIRNFKVVEGGEAPQAPAAAPTDLKADEDREGVLEVSCDKGADAALTLVLLSEKPITTYPKDGADIKVGSLIGDATVLYYGPDAKVVCHSADPLEFDTKYYIAALSASDNPMFNTTDVATAEYTSLPDVTAPRNLTATAKDNGSIEITATAAKGASYTMILISEGAFSGTVEEGKAYQVGDKIGNATVAYYGSDASIETSVNDLTPGTDYTVTGISINSRGWVMSSRATATVTAFSGIDDIEIDATAPAKVYDLQGRPVQGTPAHGIYIINGKKTSLK